MLRFRVCFGALLDGNKEHPKMQHTRKRRFSERSIFCVFGCVAFSGAFWRLPIRCFLMVPSRGFLLLRFCDGRALECVVPAIPQSEVLAKFFEEIGEECGEILANFFADFRPSISRENGRKSFHEKSSTFSTVHKIKFFHCCNSGGLGAQRM